VVGLSWSEVLARLSRRESLTAPEAEDALAVVLAGDATPAQVGAFLALLHAKGESAEEVTGLARAMLEAAVPCPLLPGTGSSGSDDVPVVVDLVGTGGDRLASINVTTLAAFITAGCGVPVCKHGNRAASSSVGTADVLEALGVAIEVGPEGVARCVAEAGMGFCFAQRFHPAMRFVGPVRRELGVPTVFNFLGPLVNPARTRHQLVGVSDETMGPIMAGVFGATGSRHAMIVHADDGLDELSVTSPSSVLCKSCGSAASAAATPWWGSASGCCGRGPRRRRCRGVVPPGEDLLPRTQEIEMHGRLAIELRGERLLHQILAFDDSRQRRPDDLVGALIGGHVGEAKLVVQLLLGDVVRADMSDHLPDHGLRLLLLAASGEQHRHRQCARERGDAPPAPRHWRYVQQGYSPELSRRRPDAGLSRNRDGWSGGRRTSIRQTRAYARDAHSTLLAHLSGRSHRRMCEGANTHSIHDNIPRCKLYRTTLTPHAQPERDHFCTRKGRADRSAFAEMRRC